MDHRDEDRRLIAPGNRHVENESPDGVAIGAFCLLERAKGFEPSTSALGRRLESPSKQASPEAWFKRKFNKDPDHSDLLDHLFDQGTRQAALPGYFEPNEQEREDGKTKVPTRAHKAIARLVRDRY